VYFLRRGLRCCRNRGKSRGAVIKSRRAAWQKVFKGVVWCKRIPDVGAGESACCWCAKGAGVVSNGRCYGEVTVLALDGVEGVW